MATLTIQLADLPSVSHVLKDETITIGRMKGNTIVIDDSSVSLSHARITRKNEEFFLKDLNSTNGTTVNGQPVNEAKLKDLDRVAFANIRGQFLAETVMPAPTAVSAVPAGAPRLATPAPTAVPAPPAMPATPSATAPRPEPAPARRRLPRSFTPYFAGAAGLLVIAGLAWEFTRTPQPEAAKAASAVAPGNRSADHTQPFLDKAGVVPPVKPPDSIPLAKDAPATDNPAESVEQLAAALKAPDAAERRRAVAALHSLPEATAALPALREALKDPDGEVRMWAALTLVNNKSYDKGTVPVFIQALQNDSPVLRQLACLSLALVPYEDSEKPTVVPLLTEIASKDTDEDVRNAAVSALRVIAPESVARTTLAPPQP